MLPLSGLLCGACQFELRELEQACWKYIQERLITGHEESVIAGSRKYKHHRRYQFIIGQVSATFI